MIFADENVDPYEVTVSKKQTSSVHFGQSRNGLQPRSKICRIMSTLQLTPPPSQEIGSGVGSIYETPCPSIGYDPPYSSSKKPPPDLSKTPPKDSMTLTLNSYISDTWSLFVTRASRFLLPDGFHKHSISTRHRAGLIDWLVDVHSSLHLEREALFRTVMLIDRFCYLKGINGVPVHRSRLTAIAITCLFISSKVSDRVVPFLTELIDVADVSKRDILKTEGMVLDTLEFDVTYPTLVCFVKTIFAMHSFPDKVRYLSNYLLELLLLCHRLSSFPPSLVAICVVSLASHLSGFSFNLACISDFLSEVFDLKSYQQLYDLIVRQLIQLQHSVKKANLSASFRKYDVASCFFVSSVDLRNFFIK
ncbi:hypothetical protein P9112_007499 [Eukaryota sp. TZLM1-RC]